MTIDHDAIAARVRQDREAGTPGPWALSSSGYNVMRGKTAATVAVAQPSDFSLSDARRISTLPDLEAAYLDLYDDRARIAAEWAEASQRNYQRAKAAEAERDALRAALDSIANNTCCEGCQEAALVARQALKGHTHD